MEAQRRRQLACSPWRNQSHCSLNQMFTGRTEVADIKMIEEFYDLEIRSRMGHRAKVYFRMQELCDTSMVSKLGLS